MIRSCETCGGPCGFDSDRGVSLVDACLGELDDVVFACCGHGPEREYDGLGYVKVADPSCFWRAFTAWIRKVTAARELSRDDHFLFLWPWPNVVQADLVPTRGLRLSPETIEVGVVVPLPPRELLS